MDRLVVLFLLLFSLSAHAIVPSGVPSLSLGGSNGENPVLIGDTNPGSYFWIYSSTDATGGSDLYIPFYKNGAQYQVTNGTTATCYAMSYSSNTASSFFQLARSNTQMSRGANSITSGTFQNGAAATYGFSTSATAGAVITEGIIYTFASQSYPCVQIKGNVSMTVRMVCREL